MADATQSFHAFEHAGWERAETVAGYDAHLSHVTMQSIDALLSDAAVTAGMRVLDVATGAGYVAAAASQLGADTIGVDFSGAQVQLARRRYPDIRFEQADAESLPFDSDSFDAVLNSFGMCHFPNPDVALREAWRVLKRGGRVAFSVWDVPDRAVAFGAIYGAIRTHGSMDVGLPVGPNFFLFSDPRECVRALSAAGFDQPTVRHVPQVWRLDSADDLFEIIAGSTVRAAATLQAQTAEARKAIRAELREKVSAYKARDRFELPMPAVIASATKP